MKTSLMNMIIITVVLGLTACGLNTSEDRTVSEDQDSKDLPLFENENIEAFWGNLNQLCGKSFAGKEVYVKKGRESWAHLPMIMYVNHCTEKAIHIPFHLGDDQSRTWMLLNEDGVLRFRHDHRHEDGTPEDLTLYGGYADFERANPLTVVFPADDYTVEVHPRSLNAEWKLFINSDLSEFNYQLFSEGELLFHAQFDLSNPL